MSGHGGNIWKLAKSCGCDPADILDFSANINPLGPPSGLYPHLRDHLDAITRYPDPENNRLIQALAATYGLHPGQIVAGNGTSDLLFALPRVLKCQRALIPVPSYIDYDTACRRAGLEIQTVDLKMEAGFQLDPLDLDERIEPGDLVILGQPNNPTSTLIDRQQMLELARRHPHAFFLIDEAFAGFVQGYDSLAGERDNLLVLISLTKVFAIPGLRLGFLAATPAICYRVRQAMPPWSVNGLAQLAGEFCLADKEHLDKSRDLVAQQREFLTDQLSRIPCLQVIPATANFLLILLRNDSIAAVELKNGLLEHFRIAIRPCDNYQGLRRPGFRIAVRTPEENKRLLEALGAMLAPQTGSLRTGRRTERTCASLMLAGTGSDVGKSVLVAGLGRVLLQDGVRVAPFKAQNMSLNSYVTRDGAEMGRAQVVQAQACRLDPDVRMNPVLLKPSSDVGSQVIVNGQPVANMAVKDYVAYKPEAWKAACQAYDALASEFDVILLEGAGSPGEVNLKHHDIVNMRMARHADAPVLLIGDIDRGGVYASFIGHLQIMEPWERELMAGFIVNRFRGDASLLEEAHTFVWERTGLSVLGVIPFLDQLELPQEDSVSFKAGLYASARPSSVHVEIVLIDLPHIANFTDVEPLLLEPDVYLRVVRTVEELGQPDAIILPGSKNVMHDFVFLERCGLARALIQLAGAGCQLVGICGGFQMLGTSIADPHGLEGPPGTIMHGLGLLSMDTELAREKTLTLRQGVHLPSGTPVRGYEIHHGVSTTNGQALIRLGDGEVAGQVSPDGHIWGSYLHGIFDDDGFRRWFIDDLRVRKGLGKLREPGACYDLEPALDRLAAHLRQHLDMERIYELLDL